MATIFIVIRDQKQIYYNGNRRLKNRAVCILGVFSKRIFMGFDSVFHIFLNVTGYVLFF